MGVWGQLNLATIGKSELRKKVSSRVKKGKSSEWAEGTLRMRF